MVIKLAALFPRLFVFLLLLRLPLARLDLRLGLGTGLEVFRNHLVKWRGGMLPRASPPCRPRKCTSTSLVLTAA